MSAQPCGCDTEERYMCREHREAAEHVIDTPPFPFPPFPFPPFVKPTRETIDVRPIRKSVKETQRLLDALSAEIGTLARRCAYADAVYCTEVEQWSASDRTLHRVREVLTTFYTAPLSVSALQPILDLAVELNPSLKDQK